MNSKQEDHETGISTRQLSQCTILVGTAFRRRQTEQEFKLSHCGMGGCYCVFRDRNIISDDNNHD